MKPNGLLKVVGILYIVFAVIGIVLGLAVAVMGGAVLGTAAASAGLGLAVGSVMGVFLIAGSVYNLIAGIMAVKGKFGACKVMGIIALVFGIIGVVAAFFSLSNVGTAVITALLELVLPVLYVIGAYKGPVE